MILFPLIDALDSIDFSSDMDETLINLKFKDIIYYVFYIKTCIIGYKFPGLILNSVV